MSTIHDFGNQMINSSDNSGQMVVDNILYTWICRLDFNDWEVFDINAYHATTHEKLDSCALNHPGASGRGEECFFNNLLNWQKQLRN